ncbi:MAG: hypothetical protein HY825_19775 [Acidobacteria bacterium]|nr:hypothetical protein [Acidobacteriota bacterium]
MSEAAFQKKVKRWATARVASLPQRRPSLGRCHPERLAVLTGKILAGWIPWSNKNNTAKWMWSEFRREVDVTIGLKTVIDSEKVTLPLIVFELKTGAWLGTDELDKKSAVYGALRELYPWIYTVFVHEDIRERGMRFQNLLRNARQFNSVFSEWTPRTIALLGELVDHRVDYTLRYWRF